MKGFFALSGLAIAYAQSAFDRSSDLGEGASDAERRKYETCKKVLLAADNGLDFSEQSKFQHMDLMIECAWLVKTYGVRSFSRSNMGLLDRYGCWCYFEDDLGYGAGSPQDDIDLMCQDLYRGYKCIELEEGCKPWQTTYNSAFGSGTWDFDLGMLNLNQECEAQNPSNMCAQKSCKVEGNFVLSYFQYAVNGGEINDSNRHDQGFDATITCGARDLNADDDIFGPTGETITTVGGGGGTTNAPATQTTLSGPVQECCGIYPMRRMFTNSDSNDCCEVALTVSQVMPLTYNPNTLTCCTDGSVSGSC